MYTITVDFHVDTRTPKEASAMAERLVRKGRRRGLQCYKRDTRVIFRPASVQEVKDVLNGYGDYNIFVDDVAVTPE